MDFILGIFVGIALMFAFSIHLYNRDKKEKDHQRDKRFHELKKIWMITTRITPGDMEYLNSSPPKYPLSKMHAECLNAQMQQALESENYEEAARIRDILNQKK